MSYPSVVDLPIYLLSVICLHLAVEFITYCCVQIPDKRQQNDRAYFELQFEEIPSIMMKAWRGHWPRYIFIQESERGEPYLACFFLCSP